jgi:hypothetical protein
MRGSRKNKKPQIIETGTRLEEGRYGSCGKTCYSAAIRAKKIQQNAKPNRLGKKRGEGREKRFTNQVCKSSQPGANSKKPANNTTQTEGRWERKMKKRGRREDGGEKCSPN